MTKITIYDIAKEANVSPAMVSRVLNKSGPVKKEKEEKILEIMKKYNYIPNALARSLTKKETKIIGIILPDISNSFFLQIYKEAEKCALEYGYNVILCNSFSDYNIESKYLKSLVEKQVDGIIFMGGRINHYDLKKKYIEEMLDIKKKVPIITINNIYDEVSSTNIITNEEKGFKSLIEYIAKKGYKNIGIILGKQGVSSTETKKDYFIKYVEEYKLHTTDEWIVFSGFSINAGIRGAERLLAQTKLPEVLMCINDVVAMGAIRKFHSAGILVPEHIKVTGFDDIETAKIFIPALTTVNQNYNKIGKLAIDSLLKQEQKEKTEKIIIDTKLVIRESLS